MIITTDTAPVDKILGCERMSQRFQRCVAVCFTFRDVIEKHDDSDYFLCGLVFLLLSLSGKLLLFLKVSRVIRVVHISLHNGLTIYQNINNIFVKVLGSYFYLTSRISKNNFLINTGFN